MLETELIYRMDSRLVAITFAGVGRATPSKSDFSSATNRDTRGVGFRYHIVHRYGFEMGADLAWGPEDTVFYITAGSAW